MDAELILTRGKGYGKIVYAETTFHRVLQQ